MDVEEGTVLPLDARVELADTLNSSETLSKVTCRVGLSGRVLVVVLVLLSSLEDVTDDSDVLVDEAELDLLRGRGALLALLSPGQIYSTPGKFQIWDVRDAIVSGSTSVDTGSVLVLYDP